MSNQAIYEYLIVILPRYQQGNRSEKSKILSEAVLVTQLSRKHLIRKLRAPHVLLKKGSKSGRPRKYPETMLLSHYIRSTWIDMDRISGKRMKSALKDWLPYYPEIPDSIKTQLLLMSASTLERFLKKIRGYEKLKGLSTTRSPAWYMKNMFPINNFSQRPVKPGFMQADTVAHCGDSAAGPFMSTLTLTDLYCGWTENRALFTKKAINVRKKITDIEQNMPFFILAINFDSGSEFLNTEILNWGRTESGKQRIVLTRSRPYKKNDNCYVEQKNYTHVRELFGYERIDQESLTVLMNEIYKNYWNPLQNFFMPQFKLKEKKRVGSKIVKKFDPPKTPYDRLMESQSLSDTQKEMLKNKKQSLNPRELKKNLESKLKDFFQKLKESKIKGVA